jgi:hypothetical protein
MNKTKSRKTKKRTITRTIKKRLITTHLKKKFIDNILSNWKKYTRGNVKKDTTTIYKNDYYLSFSKISDYFNHIHLVLHNNCTCYDNNDNNIIYVMKKFDKEKQQIIHSNEVKINIFSNPDKVVLNMIKNYDKFINGLIHT